MNLFVYGELCRAEVLRSLLDRLPDAEPAVLDGYSRRPNPATGYFEITVAPDARVAGLLLRGVDGAELRQIEQFEGGDYGLIEVSVSTPASGARNARAKVFVAAAVTGAPDAGC
jgi:hypothetical protein